MQGITGGPLQSVQATAGVTNGKSGAFSWTNQAGGRGTTGTNDGIFISFNSANSTNARTGLSTKNARVGVNKLVRVL